MKGVATATSNKKVTETVNAEITWRIDPGLRSAKNPTRVYAQQRAELSIRGGGDKRRRG